MPVSNTPLKALQRPLTRLALLLLSACSVMPAHAIAVDQADQLVEQWLDTARQSSVLEADWQEQKPLLRQRITLLEAEKSQLRSIMEESNQRRSQEASQRAKLLAQQTDMEAQQEKLHAKLQVLDSQLQSIAILLPPVLAQQWSDEHAEASDTADTSAQLQRALAQLSRLAEFNQRISVHETPVTLPDGATVIVKQLYLGVAAAWFTSLDTTYAGRGHATPDGWHWEFDASIDGAEIAKAIAIYEKKREAKFVHLPLQLYKPEAQQ